MGTRSWANAASSSASSTPPCSLTSRVRAAPSFSLSLPSYLFPFPLPLRCVSLNEREIIPQKAAISL